MERNPVKSFSINEKFLASKSMYPNVPTILHNGFGSNPPNRSVNLKFIDENNKDMTAVVFTPIVNDRGFRYATSEDNEWFLYVFPRENIPPEYDDYYSSSEVGVLCYRLGNYYIGQLNDINKVKESK